MSGGTRLGTSPGRGKPEYLILRITTTITGYTCQIIYGVVNGLKYKSIAVPTYKMDVELKGKVIASYHVTRDSWYCRGNLSRNTSQLVNRCFEPRDPAVNLYATAPLAYPTASLEAYALRQNGSEYLSAEPHIIQINTLINGDPIDDARQDLGIAKGVMIHIGGWYQAGGRNRLAGSYGCFGLIPRAQIRSSPLEAENNSKNRTYETFTPGNSAYMTAINYIKNNLPKGTPTPRVVVEKRSGIQYVKNVTN